MLYDFDGTVIASYSASDFAKLKEYPAHPQHEYLIPDGYNWELEDAKEFVAENGVLDIGAQYSTLKDDSNYGVTTYIFLRCFGGGETLTLGVARLRLRIVWGDGTAEYVTRQTSMTHTYSEPGVYICKVVGKKIKTAFDISGTCCIDGLYVGGHYTADFRVIIDDSGKGLDFLMISRLDTASYIGSLSTIIGQRLKHITIPSNIKTSGSSHLFAPTDSADATSGSGVRSICLPKDFTGTAQAFSESLQSELDLSGLTSLERLVCPDGIASINTQYGNSVRYCLSRIRFPANLSSVKLNDSPALEDVALPDKPITYKTNAFSGCSSLSSVKILHPDPLGWYMFSGNFRLKEARLPEGITAIPQGMFYNCYSLMSVNVPSTVTSIDESAFYGCSRLLSINLPDGLEVIGKQAFAFTAVEDVYVPASVTSIGSGAFAYSISGGNVVKKRCIRCGFAEGAVEGAPWGATDATIIYNATRE